MRGFRHWHAFFRISASCAVVAPIVSRLVVKEGVIGALLFSNLCLHFVHSLPRLLVDLPLTLPCHPGRAASTTSRITFLQVFSTIVTDDK